MRKIISLFLASSIDDIAFDRLAIGDFINQLNNIYESKDIFIKLYKCESEDMDHSVKLAGSQKSLDEIVESSDLCFVIFWHKAGGYTMHELEVAKAAFEKANKPKIVIYFKKIVNDSIPEDIKEIMGYIDAKMKHYYREYEHIDSLKLGIITQLQVNNYVDDELKVENDAIMLNNQSVISTNSIPLFSVNNEYLELLNRHKNLRERRKKLEEEYNKNQNNYKLGKELSKCSKECDRVKEDLDDLTNSILEIGNKLAVMTSSGVAITQNMRKAIKLFDEGDYDGVLDALPPNLIFEDLSKLNIKENCLLSERIAYIEELRLSILALKAQGKWIDVHDCYEKCVKEVAGRMDMPKTILYEYATFLYEQKQFKKCKEICELIIYCYNYKLQKTPEKDIADVNNLYGLVLFNLNEYEKSQSYFEKALEIRRSLKDTQDKKNYSIAESCNNLAKVFYAINDHKNAEKLFNEAMELYSTLQQRTNITIKMATAKKDLAQLYYQMNRHEMAANIYRETLDLLKKLSKYNNDCYDEMIYETSFKLASVYVAIIRHRKLDRYFISALMTKNKLIESENKFAFSNYLEKFTVYLKILYESKEYCKYANELSNIVESLQKQKLGDIDNIKNYLEYNFEFYNKQFDILEIEDLCYTALDMASKLARHNPEAFEIEVTKALNLLGELKVQLEEYEEAEKSFNDAIVIQNKLILFNPEYSEQMLAGTYCNMGLLYMNWNRYEKSVYYYEKAIEIYKKYADTKSGAYCNELARTYNSLANVYLNQKDKCTANLYYSKSINIYISLYYKSPVAYIDRLINTVGNIVNSLDSENEKEIMQKFLL